MNEEHERELDACAREIDDLKKKMDYWQKEAIKNAAELGELKGKVVQKDAGNIQETLNNLPDSLIGKRVWIRYSRVVVPAQIRSYFVDDEGTHVRLICEDLCGEIEHRPEDLFDTVYEALDSLDKTTI